MTWYIVQTDPQAERKATAEIRRLAEGRGAEFRVYTPKMASLRVNSRNDTKTIRRRPLFVGYIFVRFPDGYYNDLSDCDGVRRIVKRAGGAPATVPEKTIAALLRAQRQMKYDAIEARSYRMSIRAGLRQSVERAIAESMFQPGQLCLVISGPFVDKEVTVASITNAGLIEARVGGMLGKNVTKLFHPLSEVVPISLEALVEVGKAA